MGISENVIILIVRVSLFFVYLVVGAAIFQALEHENQKNNYERKLHIRQNIKNKYNISESDFRQWMDTHKANMQNQGSEEVEWTFGNSFLFAAVTITTIGEYCRNWMERCGGNRIQTVINAAN